MVSPVAAGAQFDTAMLKALETRVTTRTTFKGHLDSYRFCDQVLLQGALLVACVGWPGSCPASALVACACYLWLVSENNQTPKLLLHPRRCGHLSCPTPSCAARVRPLACAPQS